MKQIKHLLVFFSVALCFVFSSSCSQSAAKGIRPPVFTIAGYKWEQVLPVGSGTHQDRWKSGTFPMAITPIKVFDALWMIGQKSAWSSSDGIRWTQHDKTDWGERIYKPVVYFQNKLWMFGGMMYQERQYTNDIWSSADGMKWEKAGNAAWQPRGGHEVVVFKNRLWLFGGATGALTDRTQTSFLNDIWSSDDGIHWKMEKNPQAWIPRSGFRLLVVRDSIYMVGGQGQADIWRSADCKNWDLLTNEAPWKKRYDYGALLFDNKIWIFGGRDTTSNHNTGAMNDVWFSENGLNWTRQTAHAPWTVRSGGSSIVFKDRIWIYAGKHTGGPQNWGGDLWTMRADK